MLTTEEQDAILKRARALARCHLDVKRRLERSDWTFSPPQWVKNSATGGVWATPQKFHYTGG